MIPAVPPLPPLPDPSKSKCLRLGLFLVLIGTASFLWVARSAGPPKIVHFQVRRGLSAHGVAEDLYDQGLIRHPWSFLVWVKVFGRPGAIKPGVYELSSRES